MKVFLTTLCIVLLTLRANAQTAPNFTATDCSGMQHDLYAEMDAGTIIVLDWVMPCTECALPSLTAYNVVKGFQKEYPNRVLLYMIDDYANTNCTSLGGWATSYSIAQSSFLVKFSTSKIVMSDFGEPGMPKFVLVGGTSHTMLYRSENVIDGLALQSAIAKQLQQSTDVRFESEVSPVLSVSPNPASAAIEIGLRSTFEAVVDIEVVDAIGRVAVSLPQTTIAAGNSSLSVNTEGLESGLYSLRMRSAGVSRCTSLMVVH